MEKSLLEYLRHPMSLATAVVGTVASIVQLPFAVEFVSWLVSSSGTLFTASSVFAFTVLPEVNPGLADLATPVAIGLGVIFGASRLYRAGKKFKKSIGK